MDETAGKPTPPRRHTDEALALHMLRRDGCINIYSAGTCDREAARRRAVIYRLRKRGYKILSDGSRNRRHATYWLVEGDAE